jgi:hypothetical protein
LAVTKKYFGSIGTCGSMNPDKIKLFLTWLIDKNLENNKILGQHLFTNDLLE